MNQRTTILALALALGLPLAAQKLVIEKANVNVGATAWQRPVTATFNLRNKGSRRMRIESAQASCGCAQADYPRKEIGGGETFQVRLTYDAGQLGTFQKQVALRIAGLKAPVWLTMTGRVVADMGEDLSQFTCQIGDLLTDRRDFEFDDVNRGDTPQQDFFVLNGGTTMADVSVMHLPPYLEADITPQKIAPGRTGKITLRLNSEKLHDYGLTQTSVYLGGKLGEKVSLANEMTVSAVLLPAFPAMTEEQKQNAPKMALSADSLAIAFEGKKKHSETITIGNTGRTTLKISALQMFTGGMKVTLDKREVEPGQQAKLRITLYRDQLLAQRQKPRVLMITNDPERAKTTIKLKVNN